MNSKSRSYLNQEKGKLHLSVQKFIQLYRRVDLIVSENFVVMRTSKWEQRLIFIPGTFISTITVWKENLYNFTDGLVTIYHHVLTNNNVFVCKINYIVAF